MLGAAILGATAGAAHRSVEAAMGAMSAVGETVRPRTHDDVALTALHERKYRVFRRLSDEQLKCRRIMEGSA